MASLLADAAGPGGTARRGRHQRRRARHPPGRRLRGPRPRRSRSSRPQTLAALRALLPPQAGVANPIDLLASATPEQYARTIEVVGADPSVDALVVIYMPPMVTDPEEIAAAIARGAGTVPADKPVLTVFLSSHGAPAALAHGAARPPPGLPLSRERRARPRRRRALRPLAPAAARHGARARPLRGERGPGGDRPRARRRRRAALARARRPRDGAARGRHRLRRMASRSRPPRPRPRPSAWGFRWWPRRSRRASSTRATWAASCSVSSRRRRSPGGGDAARAHARDRHAPRGGLPPARGARRNRGPRRRHDGRHLRPAPRVRARRRARRARARRRLPPAPRERCRRARDAGRGCGRADCWTAIAACRREIGMRSSRSSRASRRWSRSCPSCASSISTRSRCSSRAAG